MAQYFLKIAKFAELALQIDGFVEKACHVGLLIRSILHGKNCTSASARVQFFQRKIERINRPTRHVLF